MSPVSFLSLIRRRPWRRRRPDAAARRGALPRRGIHRRAAPRHRGGVLRRAPRVSAASTTDLCGPARPGTLEDVQQSFLPDQRSASAVATKRNVSVTDARARGRANSFCSNEPSSSEVSVAAGPGAPQCPPARPAEPATLVLPLAGGPSEWSSTRATRGAPPLQRARLARSTAGFASARRGGDADVFAFSKTFSSRKRGRVAETTRQTPPTHAVTTVTAMVRRFRQTNVIDVLSMTPRTPRGTTRALSAVRRAAQAPGKSSRASRASLRDDTKILRIIFVGSGSVTVFSDPSSARDRATFATRGRRRARTSAGRRG